MLKEGQRENVEETLKEFMKSKLQFTEQEVAGIEYQRLHRVQTGPTPKPIKVRYLRYKDKVAVQQRAKNLKGTTMYISDDLSRRVRMERRDQLEALKAARNAGKLAFFSKTDPSKLFVDHVWLQKKDQAKFVEKLEKLEERTREALKKGAQVVRPKSTNQAKKLPPIMPMETDQGASAGNIPIN